MDILTIGLEPRFKYRDFDYSCDFTPFSPVFFLTAEVDSGKIIRANMRKNYYSSASQTIVLEPEELAGIELFQSPSQEIWLKNFTVSERVLRMFFHGGQNSGFGSCFPPSELTADLTPNTFTFTYLQKGLDGATATTELNSNTGVFRGTNKAGKHYQISLLLRQSQL